METPPNALTGAGFLHSGDSGPVATKPLFGKPARSPAGSDARAWIVVDTGMTICFASLIVGGGAFAIIAIAALAMMTGPNILPKLLSGGGGDFVGILLFWSALAWMGSFVSLLTGWGVCWVVPKATKARILIQSALGCVGAAIGIILFTQLLDLAMAPSISGPPPRTAELKKSQADVERAAKQRETNKKIMDIINKGLLWLSMLAPIASFAAFGLFLVRLGEHLGAAQLKPLAIYFGILQGVFALWLTLVPFITDGSSQTFERLCMILTILFMLATYGGLIYLAHNTRRLVANIGAP